MNGKPETREAVPDIPPGFMPMPKMVTVPIIGYTADIPPISAEKPNEGKDAGLCREM